MSKQQIGIDHKRVTKGRVPHLDDALKFGKDFTAGACAAVISKTVIAPIERVKLILQLQNAQPTISISNRYKGIFDCFIRLPKEQGNIIVGGASGISTYCIIYPLDFVRTRLAVDMGKGKYREFQGFFDCMKKVCRREGLRGLYFGFWPSLQYIFLYRGAYYGLFDSAKVLVPSNERQEISFASAFIIGQVVTFTAAFVSYPLDTVRRRLMMQSAGDETYQRGVWRCTMKIFCEEGLHGFFKGMMANTIRGTGAALVLAIYNEISKYM